MKTILITIIFISLLSCTKVKYGNITDRWYEEKNTTILLMPMIIGKVTVLMPYIFVDNEDWCVTVKGIDDKGDTVNIKLYVTEEAYDTLTIGKFICLDGQCDEDLNNTKTKE